MKTTPVIAFFALAVATIATTTWADTRELVLTFYNDMALALENADNTKLSEYIDDSGYIMVDHANGGGTEIRLDKVKALDARLVWAKKVEDGKLISVTAPSKISVEEDKVVVDVRMIELYPSPDNIAGYLRFRDTFRLHEGRLQIVRSDLLEFRGFAIHEEVKTPKPK